MDAQELSQLWSEFFASPYPQGATFFWKQHSKYIVRKGFAALVEAMETHTFNSLAHACRYASAVMRREDAEAGMFSEPAPEVREPAEHPTPQ